MNMLVTNEIATENLEEPCSSPKRCPRCNSACSDMTYLRRFNRWSNCHKYLSEKTDILIAGRKLSYHKRGMTTCLLCTSLQCIPSSMPNGVELYHIKAWRIVVEAGPLGRTSPYPCLDGKQGLTSVNTILKYLPKYSFIFTQN